MKRYILLLLLSTFSLSLTAQSVCEGDVVLTTQTEVDNFNCSIVKGTVLISGPDITNLHALSSLVRVNEHFIIQNTPRLNNLDGLENLKHVTCSFELKNNNNITEVNAVSNLQRVGRHLTFISNPSLRSLEGISQIDSVMNLAVFDNPGLAYCCELAPIVQNGGVFGSIRVFNNGSFCKEETIDTCSGDNGECVGDVILSTQEEVNNFNCKRIVGDLRIGAFDEPLNLEPLFMLTEVTGDIHVDLQGGGYITGERGFRNLIKANSLNFGAYADGQIIDLAAFENLRSVEFFGGTDIDFINSFPVLEELNRVGFIASSLEEDKWLDPIESIQSANFLSFYNAAQTEKILSKIEEGGRIDMAFTDFNNLEGLKDRKFLDRLFITLSTGKSLDGLTNLESTNYLGITESSMSDGCCGLSNYLLLNPDPGSTFTFEDNSCSLQEIFGCSGICPGDYTVSNQTEADNFKCRIVEGDLLIDGTWLFLDSLVSLEEVTGDLKIEADFGPVNLNGLQYLSNIGQNLIIRNNQLLTNTQSLLNLESIGGNIIIENNPDLTSIRGIEGVSNPSDIIIRNNPKLDVCCELEDLTSRASGSVIISGNGQFCSPQGFNICDDDPGICIGDRYINNQLEADLFACTQITGSLHIYLANPVDGANLFQLDSITGNLGLNIDYDYVNGLQNLSYVGGTLQPAAYKNFGSQFNFNSLENLEHLGGFKSAVASLDGQLSGIKDTINFIGLEYGNTFSNQDWIPNIDVIDSLYIYNPTDYDFYVQDLLSHVSSEGHVLLRDLYVSNFSGLTGKTTLQSLTLDYGNIDSFDGLEDLNRVDNLEILYVNAEDCCGLYNLLMDGEIKELNFLGNSCSIEEILTGCAPEEVLSISVYPNPSSDGNVKVKWKGDRENSSFIQVLDNFGKVILEETLPASSGYQDAQIDLSGLSAGTFLVRIITGEHVELRRLVRE